MIIWAEKWCKEIIYYHLPSKIILQLFFVTVSDYNIDVNFNCSGIVGLPQDFFGLLRAILGVLIENWQTKGSKHDFQLMFTQCWASVADVEPK